jgi:hypothetical protein
VSDEYHAALAQTLLARGKPTHWFPLGEFWGLSLASIYGALFILWEAEQRQQRVYLHCHAGVNRSQTVADCYYFLRTGKHRPRRAWARGPQTANALQRNSDHHALPPLAVMEAWLQALRYAVERPLPGWMDACHEQAGLPGLFAHPSRASPESGVR